MNEEEIKTIKTAIGAVESEEKSYEEAYLALDQAIRVFGRKLHRSLYGRAESHAELKTMLSGINPEVLSRKIDVPTQTLNQVLSPFINKPVTEFSELVRDIENYFLKKDEWKTRQQAEAEFTRKYETFWGKNRQS